MLTLKIIVFAFVMSRSVLGRDTSRGNVRQKQTEEDYKYHHPPAPENYEAIPVAVLYEDDINREDKSIKNTSSRNDAKHANNDLLKPEFSVTKASTGFKVGEEQHIDTKPTDFEPEDIKVTTYRPQKEQQIPVAVIYEPESKYYQTPRPNGNRITNTRRKIQQNVLDEKSTDVENDDSSSTLVNGHTGPLSTVDIQDYFNKRRRIQRPIPQGNQTTVEGTFSSNAQANQYTPTVLTEQKPEVLNNRRRSQRPTPEKKQTAVEEDTSFRTQGRVNTPSLSTTNQPEINHNKQVIRRPASEKGQSEVEYNTSVPENENTPIAAINKKPDEFNTRRKIQRPIPEEKQTTLKGFLSSNAQAIQFKPTVPSVEKPEELNNRRRSQRPTPENKLTAVEENTSFRAQERVNTPTLTTVNQPEENHNRQVIQLPALEKVQSDVGYNISVPENENTSVAAINNKPDEFTVAAINKKPDEFTTRQTIQRPVTEKKQITAEDNYNPRQGEHESTPKVEEFYNGNENTQQFSRRGDSSRIREVIPIVQSKNIVYSQSGNFQYSYEGGDGTKAFETGELRTFDDESAGEAVSGGFSYTAKDGNEYSLSYTADENGYRPVGAHLPTPPPIPPAIARALAYLATKTTPEPITESIAEYDE